MVYLFVISDMSLSVLENVIRISTDVKSHIKVGLNIFNLKMKAGSAAWGVIGIELGVMEYGYFLCNR